MKKLFFFCSVLFLTNCTNYGQLIVVSDLPKILNEVSGVGQIKDSDLLWMLNDSGNSPTLFGVSTQGKIIKIVAVKATNNDWEDLASDTEGNLYIADFGNNSNRRKDLVILKIRQEDVLTKKSVEVERIEFSYPNQEKFPPKKKRRFFDAESLFWLNGYLYIFTKSRVKKKLGKTSLYRIPAVPGNHKAEFISEFSSGNETGCWITSAAISPDGKKMVLLNHNAVWVFTNFKGDDFFSGKSIRLPFNHSSQKESIHFKNDSTVYITDERSHGVGGNLYEFTLY